MMAPALVEGLGALLGFRVWGLGVWGLGFRVWGLGFRGLGLRGWGLGFRRLIVAEVRELGIRGSALC